MTRLRELYDNVVKENIQSVFNYRNPMEIPKLEKIVINMGVGEAVLDSKKVDIAANEMSLIAGLKQIIIKSRKSVATFKLREGMSVGCKVTLRRDRMYEILDRLINIALPQVRDFRGLSNKSFDGRGNYALGLKEQIVFPEIDNDAVDEMRGMDIVIATSAKTDGEAKALLKGFNMPIN